MSDVINGVSRELLERSAQMIQFYVEYLCATNSEESDIELAGECVDELRALLTAQPQASRCPDCGYLTSQREHLGCLRKAVAELDAATGGQPQASAAQSAPVVPDGYVLVPVEPTEEMAKVGTDARWQSCVRDANCVRSIYRAMLAAAPAQPAARQEHGLAAQVRKAQAEIDTWPDSVRKNHGLPARHDHGDEVQRLREALDCDRAYRNGLQAGYSFGACGDEDGYQRSLHSYQREIHAALTQSPKGEEE